MDLLVATQMRDIKYIIIHCSDTPPDMDIGYNEIREWHIARGFNGCGYHYIIRRNGTVEAGRSEYEVGSHVKGYNDNSIGICLVGGKTGRTDDITNFTPEQIISAKQLCYKLKIKYNTAKIMGHRDFTDEKTCPNFDIKLLEIA
jgi:N-acetylmuramoyl-L-alanine amidase